MSHPIVAKRIKALRKAMKRNSFRQLRSTATAARMAVEKHLAKDSLEYNSLKRELLMVEILIRAKWNKQSPRNLQPRDK